MNAPPAYQRLRARFERIATIDECAAMLGWDAAVTMPPGGGGARADQLAALAGLAHGLMIAPETGDDLAEAEAVPAPSNPWDARNLQLMRHAHTRATAVPADLVEAQARANSTCEKIWREARRASDFALVRPHLAEVINLVRQQAAALSPALGLAPYDALMDTYQRGVTGEDVAAIFGTYQAFLAHALPAAEARQAARPAPMTPSGPFPVAAQEALCRIVSERIGLDFNFARLDRSAHPFSGGTQTDVRITTRYEPADFTQAVMGVIHETGHAMYERGLPSAYVRQPVGQAAGMAIHESQSLIVEMQACREDSYLTWLGGQLHARFNGDPEPYRVENLGRVWRKVERSFIRTEADEMTYPAHVILRFNLERALISGELAAADLPGAWNDGMRQVLGVTPPDDARGCLQDIHWYDGAFGYFPSYTLGAMAAAQLMRTAVANVPGLKAAMAEGDLSPLMGWLRAHIHTLGSLYGFHDLLKSATGKRLDPEDFQNHLRERYLT